MVKVTIGFKKMSRRARLRKQQENKTIILNRKILIDSKLIEFRFKILKSKKGKFNGLVGLYGFTAVITNRNMINELQLNLLTKKVINTVKA